VGRFIAKPSGRGLLIVVAPLTLKFEDVLLSLLGPIGKRNDEDVKKVVQDQITGLQWQCRGPLTLIT
jgi:hypothetical protein